MKVDKQNQVAFRDGVIVEIFAEVDEKTWGPVEVSLRASLVRENGLVAEDFELEECLDLSMLGSIEIVFDQRSSGFSDAIFYGVSDALGRAATVSIIGTVTFLDENQDEINQDGDDLKLDVSFEFAGGRRLVIQKPVSIKELLPFVVCHKVDYSSSK